ncbi:MAG TPA: MarR family transcriptional regulator [Polyangiaceae bacterium]|jgi:DNA-binding MarR family transcriptional regulator
MAKKSDPPFTDLSFALGRAYYNYVGVLELVLEDEGLGSWVKPGMGHVLFALFQRDDLNIKDLVEQLQVSPSTLTGLLGRMETAGLLERSRDPNDGRAVRLRLTRRGRSLEQRCWLVHRRMSRFYRAFLTSQEQASLEQLLNKAIQGLRECESKLRGENRARDRDARL